MSSADILLENSLNHQRDLLKIVQHKRDGYDQECKTILNRILVIRRTIHQLNLERINGNKDENVGSR